LGVKIISAVMIEQQNLRTHTEEGVLSYLPVWVILLLILLVAGFLRLVYFGDSPPGLNPDEATNAWNAWCLLKTGKDQVGVSWPVFYTRGLGGNNTTLYIYLLIPFQAIGGMNVTTTRLPAAAGGILTVLLIYYVGRRLFDWKTGLAAAGLLALNPWHIQQSRWGHEASINALLGLAPLVMLLWANMPVCDNVSGRPRPVIAGLAGAIAGICCYGYHAVRVFIPVFLFAIVLVTLPGWVRCLRTRVGALAIFAFIAGFAVTFGPLAWQHIFYPAEIGRHALYQKMYWAKSDSISTFLKNVAGRYFPHYGLDFLFIKGDPFIIQSPPNMGQFHWYELPIMVVGLITIVRRFRKSASARVLLAFVLVYPVGDILCPVWGMHALRSAPGLCGLVLLGAAGAAGATRWLWKWNRKTTEKVIIAFVVAVIILNVKFLHDFYGKYNREDKIWESYHIDLLEACKWLRPRLNDFDAVFCTKTKMNMPYIVSLVALEWEPGRWFNEPRDFTTIGEWDYCIRHGKMYFMTARFDSMSDFVGSAFSNAGYRPGGVLLIIRPNEMYIKDPKRQILHRVIGPHGKETLWLCRI
jgi:4-amino-4-deoxy-L-arabinose transferase-like glycosyltransferase